MSFAIVYTDKAKTTTTLRCSIYRAVDGLVYDTSDGTFKAIGSISGTNYDIGMTEGTTIYLGRWTGSVSSTPVANFSDGRYIATIHDSSDSNKSIAAGEVYFKVGEEVHLDISPSQNVGYDADGTVHEKLGDFSASDTVRDALNELAGNNILLSVAPGEFQIIADIGQVGQSVPSNSFSLPVVSEHAKRWDFTVKRLDGTVVDLSSTKVRFLVQDTAGDGITVRLDVNTTSDPASIGFTSATLGKFFIELTRSQTNLSATGGNGAGIYYAEILWDQNNNGEYKVFAVGSFNVQAGGDILAG